MTTRRNLLAGTGAFLVTQSMVADGRVQPRARMLPERARWAVYYGQTLPEGALDGYTVAVLDPGLQGDLEAIRARGTTTLGYLSLGEINRSHPSFARLPGVDMLLAENPNWPGSFSVDLRSQDWGRFVSSYLAPEVLRRGFDGFFLDTLDSSLALETNDPSTFEGIHAAAIKLVQSLRKGYPSAPIMMNRAYALLPELAPELDAVLAESLLGTYDFSSNTYQTVSDTQTRIQMALLAPARTSIPPLPIYSLDYWDPADTRGTISLYAAERALGHSPYVSTILLDSIAREPLS